MISCGGTVDCRKNIHVDKKGNDNNKQCNEDAKRPHESMACNGMEKKKSGKRVSEKKVGKG